MGSLLKRMISIPVYSSGSIPDPVGWMQPTLYWSFNNLDGLVLMEGTEQRDYDALIEGKVGHNNPRLKFCFNNAKKLFQFF